MKITAILFFLFGLLALGTGIYMFVDRSLLNQFDQSFRTIFAVILILYGIFRVASSIGAMKKTSSKPTGAQ